MKFWFALVITAVAVAAVSCESPGAKSSPSAVAYVPEDAAATPLVTAARPVTQPAMMTAGAPTTVPATKGPVETVVTTQPLLGMATTGPTTQSTELGAAFVSPIDGIQFNPPRGGILRRVLNSGEIVGYSYPDRGWDLRVKPVPLPLTTEIKLTDKKNSGLLELTAGQLVTANESTRILVQQVFSFNDSPAGLIEARYNLGIDTVFAQEVLLREGLTTYAMIQMVSPGGITPEGALKEAEARRVFHEVLGTFKLLDRAGLRALQDEWILNTEGWYGKLTGEQIKAAIVPMQYMRVLQSSVDPRTKETVKKDIGFMQFFEREITQDGRPGVQIVVRSYLQRQPDQAVLPASVAPTTQPGQEQDRVVVPDSISPVAAAANPVRQVVTMQTGSDYFMTFDRTHESWLTDLVTDDGSRPVEEFGSSDMYVRHKLDVKTQTEQAAIRNGNGQPPVIEVRVRTLNVMPPTGKPVDPPILTFCYLPQLMGQMLPRLLPTNEPKVYAFCYYVSEIKSAMFRYVEVGKPEDVVLDGVLHHAIPIKDRIGVEGIPTTQYVSADGKWLGSLNGQTGMEVLPTTPAVLKTIWNGFKEYPEPELPKESPRGHPGTIKPAERSILEDR